MNYDKEDFINPKIFATIFSSEVNVIRNFILSIFTYGYAYCSCDLTFYVEQMHVPNLYALALHN